RRPTLGEASVRCSMPRATAPKAGDDQRTFECSSCPMQKQPPSSSRQTPDHKFTFSVSPESRPWWRIWNDYPNPTRDAVVGAFGIAVIVIVFWFLAAR